jgi:hypothetical protein
VNATYEHTECRSHHMTSFASGFFFEPSPTDFNLAPTTPKAGFSDSMSVYVVIIVTLAVFFLLALIGL